LQLGHNTKGRDGYANQQNQNDGRDSEDENFRQALDRGNQHIAHMSREAFAELKRAHKGAALERAIAQWIAEHDR
jgi:hypothetical protein